jgi:hypothetical protein
MNELILSLMGVGVGYVLALRKVNRWKQSHDDGRLALNRMANHTAFALRDLEELDTQSAASELHKAKTFYTEFHHGGG